MRAEVEVELGARVAASDSRISLGEQKLRLRLRSPNREGSSRHRQDPDPVGMLKLSEALELSDAR
jgi:hypothetical protein